jgi:hypothetical protein
MLFHVTENLLKKVGFENKKIFVANARGPAGGGGVQAHWGMHPTLCCLAPL